MEKPIYFSEKEPEFYEMERALKRLEEENVELKTFVRLLKKENNEIDRKIKEYHFNSKLLSFGEALIFFLIVCVAIAFAGTIFYFMIKHGK